MASRTILHVGTMKSGTSHIQSRLFVNREALGEAGILVPGRRWGHQARGVTDLLRTQRRGRPRRRGRGSGAWQRIADEVASHPGTAVISMEFLGPSTPEHIAGITASLPGVEAVITARDLNRSLAAMWQETIQNGSTWSYRDYLDSAEEGRPGAWKSSEPPPRPGRSFWRQQDVVRMAQDWQAVVPVTLITVPPPGAARSLLWERFCRVLGVSGDAAWADARRSNESLGAASAQLLRRVNEALVEDGPTGRPANRVRKQLLAKQVLASRKSEEPAIGLPVAPWVAEESARMVAELGRLDLTLLGDWTELQPVTVPGVDPVEVTPEEVVDAAVAGLAAMVGRARRGRSRAV